MKKRVITLQPASAVITPAIKKVRSEDYHLNASLVEGALREWVWARLDFGNLTAEAEERRSALAEVGHLLTLEREKYPTSKEMREEIEELVEQLGGTHLIDEFIIFLLNLRKTPPPPPSL